MTSDIKECSHVIRLLFCYLMSLLDSFKINRVVLYGTISSKVLYMLIQTVVQCHCLHMLKWKLSLLSLYEFSNNKYSNLDHRELFVFLLTNEFTKPTV